MGYSLTRLTFYGILSAFDEDLRQVVKSLCNDTVSFEDFVGADIYSKLRTRRISNSENDRSELLDFLDLGDSIQLINKHKRSLDSVAQIFFDKNAAMLRDIVPIRNRVMHARPLEYSDGTKIDKLSESVNKLPRLFKNTLGFLTELGNNPYFPFSLEAGSIGAPDPSANHNLPIPDFDETGFLGRNTETNQLLAACKGPWPIITVVAEGGYGKTAIALQAAYRLLDEPDNPFDFIVWTTSKTTRLSLREIEVIEGAISDSMGVIHDAGATLGGSKKSTIEDATSELLEYLNNFKILLILDNLETVLDKNIINLFSRLNGKSKVLATSRLGTGEMNYRFPIGALTEDDSVRLLRSTAKVRGVSQLHRAKHEELSKYCRRMKGNPGFIKWFVSSVQCGKRPEEVLVEPKIFLDFCLSNVYNYMSTDARLVASVMLAVPGQHTQSTLSYISDISGDRFQKALQELWSANLVTMSSVTTATGYQTVYELGELPRLYIIKNHPSSQSTVKAFQSRKREIEQFYRSNFMGSKKDEYNLGTIKLRTKDDSVVAKYLRDALASGLTDYEFAMNLIDKAKALDPGYYEVYRIEAMIQRAKGNFPATVECYELAVECEPNSAPLRYWYGGFLMRDADDIEGALLQFGKALDTDPTSPSVALEYARCLMFDGKYELADGVLGKVDQEADLIPIVSRKIADLSLQIALRRADQETVIEEKVIALNLVFARFFGLDRSKIDGKCMETAFKAESLAVRTASSGDMQSGSLNHSKLLENIKIFNDRLSEQVVTRAERRSRSPSDRDIGGFKAGTIKNYNDSKRFGFISYDDGIDIFFHVSDLALGTTVITPGDPVTFLIEKQGQKFYAREVKLGNDPNKSYLEVGGIVKTVVREKHFGFVFSDDGNELFFHRDFCITPFEEIEDGDKVTFIEGLNHVGKCAKNLIKTKT